MPDDNPLPKPSAGDHAHLAVKAIVSAIPVAGGPAAELFGAIIAPPLTRRRDAWFAQLAEDLKALNAKVASFSLDALHENENFVSGVLQATRIAMQTHQKEKIEALRNALLNMAIATNPDEDQQAMFLAHIETLTPSHIRVLCAHRDPLPAFPRVAPPDGLLKQVAADLIARGFLKTPLPKPNSWVVTELGLKFLAFIQAPPDLQR